MNAHTDTNRKERYIAYDTNTGGDYSTALRVENRRTKQTNFSGGWKMPEIIGYIS